LQANFEMQKLAQASGAGRGKKALEILPALPRQRFANGTRPAM
jgi:hypothetical protein